MSELFALFKHMLLFYVAYYFCVGMMICLFYFQLNIQEMKVVATALEMIR